MIVENPKIFPSVSFHITKPCNMGCKFCYSTYENLGKVKMLKLDDAFTILDKLAKAGVKKVTFAGGEPMLHPDLSTMISYSKNVLNMTTSLITNGSLLDINFLTHMKSSLDWIGLSIDSFDFEVNKKIGRVEKGQNMVLPYRYLLGKLNELDYKVKVNTVINSYNYKDFCSTIDILNQYKIDRFKVLRTLPIKGENQQDWNEISCTDSMWKKSLSYLDLYDRLVREGEVDNNLKKIVIEDNEAMTASYLLVSPTGQLYENSKGEHTFGPNLIQHSIEDCLEPLNLDFETFVKRGGIYNW